MSTSQQNLVCRSDDTPFPPVNRSLLRVAPGATASPEAPPAGQAPLLARGLVAAWRRFLALTRLSRTAVCAASAGLGKYDYHNYRDDENEVDWFTEGGGRCKRCGKVFRL